MDDHAVNVLILAVGVPTVGGIALIVYALRKAMDAGLGRLDVTLGKMETALIGLSGTEGVIGEVKELRRRTHRLESIVTALVVHSGVKLREEDKV